MAKKIECPFDNNALHELYTAGRSTAICAEYEAITGHTINKTTAIRWAKNAGVEVTNYSPYTTKIACPFTRDRLYELYWREGLSLMDIANLAASALNCNVSWGTVRNWLEQHDIKTRTPHEWLTVRSKSDPERWREHARKHLRGKSQNAGAGCGLSKKIQRMGRRAAAAKKKDGMPRNSRMRSVRQECDQAEKFVSPPARINLLQ